MREAVRLARRGIGRTSPNPPVGAVVVARGRIIGRGYHRRAGEPHAEIEALAAAGDGARGATLYVTLEPCNHHGRTPPCTAAVIRAGVRRVVIGARDPNPHVTGQGVETLRRDGIAVNVGLEEAACAALVVPFAKFVRTGLPHVTLKLAASLDGRIATRTGASRWVTGEAARRYVHRLRDQVDAVMVGASTVIADNPSLTCRLRGGRDPLRVVVDGRLRIPLDCQVLTNAAAPGTVVATVNSKARMIGTLRQRGATVLVLPGRGGTLSVRRLLARLGRRGIMSVLIEGGATLAAAALREGVVDRLLCFYAPKLIGADGRAMVGPLDVRTLDQSLTVRAMRVARIGEDILVTAELGARDAG